MTAVRRSLASTLGVFSEKSVSRKSDVVIRVMTRSRGGTTIDINEGEVILELTDAERISLMESLDRPRHRDSGCAPNEGTV